MLDVYIHSFFILLCIYICALMGLHIYMGFPPLESLRAHSTHIDLVLTWYQSYGSRVLSLLPSALLSSSAASVSPFGDLGNSFRQHRRPRHLFPVASATSASPSLVHSHSELIDLVDSGNLVGQPQYRRQRLRAASASASGDSSSFLGDLRRRRQLHR